MHCITLSDLTGWYTSVEISARQEKYVQYYLPTQILTWHALISFVSVTLKVPNPTIYFLYWTIDSSVPPYVTHDNLCGIVLIDTCCTSKKHWDIWVFICSLNSVNIYHIVVCVLHLIQMVIFSSMIYIFVGERCVSFISRIWRFRSFSTRFPSFCDHTLVQLGRGRSRDIGASP
jgi:hypothetical protein